MTSPSDLVPCFIEKKDYPRAGCHVHHRNPRHAGGSDAATNLVWLCATCHQLVHRGAQMVKANRKGDMADLAMLTFPAPAPRQRFLEVVQQEVEASAHAKEAGIGRKDVVVEVPIPREDYERLKRLVSDYKANGKKLSISNFVARLVLAHVNKRSP